MHRIKRPSLTRPRTLRPRVLLPLPPHVSVVSNNGITCVPWSDGRRNGRPVDEADRTADNQCKDCSRGFFLRARLCVPCPASEFQDDGASTAGSCAACPDSDAASCGVDGSRIGTRCSAESGVGYKCTKFADIDPRQCGPGQERTGLTTASVDNVQDLRYECKDCINGATFKFGTNTDKCQPCKNTRCGGGERRQGTCSGGSNGFTCQTCPTKTFKVGSTEATTWTRATTRTATGPQAARRSSMRAARAVARRTGSSATRAATSGAGKAAAARATAAEGTTGMWDPRG